MKKIRCAIYTRKSAEEGLEQEFNSLDAQREACAAYVASQKAEGWVLLPTVYEDAGLSGGTLERPGLQRLLDDIDAGLVDQIVVYKVDRLTRSLSDFAKLVERLEAAGAVFVSVTQSFNTATSMGRLTLHMLLSFAQFEREVTAERIRDKVAASKRKGLWMGGRVPLGYEKDERTLRINEAEAETVRTLYALYRKHGTLRQVKTDADRLRLRTKQRFAADGTRTGGLPFRRGHLHCLLTNPLYAGRIRHQRRVYEGQHPSIIAPELWDAVQAQLQAGAAKPRRRTTKGRRGAGSDRGPCGQRKRGRPRGSESRLRLPRRSWPSTFWSRCAPGLDPSLRPGAWHPVAGRCFPCACGEPESPTSPPTRPRSGARHGAMTIETARRASLEFVCVFGQDGIRRPDPVRSTPRTVTIMMATVPQGPSHHTRRYVK